MAKRAQLPKGGKGAAAPKPSAKTKGAAMPRGMLLGIIAAVVLLAVGLIWLAIQSSQRPAVSTPRVGEGAAWGPADAPVQVVDYSDFGCSFCGSFARNQGVQLRQEYESTGKVRFEFKHFIIGGQRTRDAALAAECAADQGRFWDYHDTLFARQGTSSDPFNRSALKQYAVQLGLDTAQFNACLDSNKHLEKVTRDTSDGRGLGVNATPTFFVNGQKIEGAQPYSVFKAAIDAALAAAQ